MARRYSRPLTISLTDTANRSSAHHEGTKDTKKHEEGQVQKKMEWLRRRHCNPMELSRKHPPASDNNFIQTIFKLLFVFLRDLRVFVVRINPL